MENPFDENILAATLVARERALKADELAPAEKTKEMQRGHKASLRVIKKAERRFGGKVAKRKTYSDEQKKEILAFRKDHTLAETSKKYGVSTASLMNWGGSNGSKGSRRGKRAGRKMKASGDPIGAAISALKNAIAALERVKSASLADLF